MTLYDFICCAFRNYLERRRRGFCLNEDTVPTICWMQRDKFPDTWPKRRPE